MNMGANMRIKLSLLAFMLPLVTVQIHAQAIQHKACARTVAYPLAAGYVVPCHFDNPIKQGDTLVQIALGTGLPSPDTLGNVWQTALNVPYFRDSSLFYVLDAKGGDDTVNFPANVNPVWDAFIAEYPPSTGLDAVAFNTYVGPNLDQPVGGINDTGWTLPVETKESGEILIAWELHAAQPGTSPYVATPGPGFTLRDTAYGIFMFEDRWTEGPGLYIASVHWNVYAVWTMGIAAFKMK